MRVWLVVGIFVALLFAGCTEAPDPDIDIHHVHGLAYDPTRAALFVATHDGLAKGVEQDGRWTWSYVGQDRYDYMGFTQDATTPGIFYSSGHPNDPAAFGGPHLGLRRSTDGGATWEQRAFRGEVDFHILTSFPGGEGRLAGIWRGVLKVSFDGGLTWADRSLPWPGAPVLASGADVLYAATGDALYETRDLERLEDWSSVERRSGAFDRFITLTGASEGGLLLASTAGGAVAGPFRSTNGGVDWSPVSNDAFKGAPVHFAVDPSDGTHAFAVTGAAHIYESHDAGATWTRIRGD